MAMIDDADHEFRDSVGLAADKGPDKRLYVYLYLFA